MLPPTMDLLVVVVVTNLKETCLALELATHLHLVPDQERVELYLQYPIRLHGMVFNKYQRQLYFRVFCVLSP
jgi:hypothetical protein